MAELWCPFARRRPGPSWKVGYWDTRERQGKGAVFHSAEGPLDVMLDILDGPAEKSWTFSNPKVGCLLQHYPLEAVTWHAGPTANRLFWGEEHEGIAGEPLTENQIENDVELLRWAANVENWPEFSRGSTLREHNEFVATACPSGRIPWDRILQDLENDMSDEEKLELTLRRGAARLQKLLADLEFQKVANLLAYIGVRAQGSK